MSNHNLVKSLTFGGQDLMFLCKNAFTELALWKILLIWSLKDKCSSTVTSMYIFHTCDCFDEVVLNIIVTKDYLQIISHLVG